MIKKCERGIYKVSQGLTSIALIAMVLLTVAEIITRQIFGSSLLIVDEYCGYLMVVLAYWGAVNAFLDGEFVRVDALFDKLSAKSKNAANFVFSIIFLGINGLVTYNAWLNTAKAIKRGDVAATIAQTPLAIPKMFMVIGLVLLELALLFRIIEYIQSFAKKPDIEGTGGSN